MSNLLNTLTIPDNFIHTLKYIIMITDSQIFLALGVALIAAIFAIGLGRQLYV